MNSLANQAALCDNAGSAAFHTQTFNHSHRGDAAPDWYLRNLEARGQLRPGCHKANVKITTRLAESRTSP